MTVACSVDALARAYFAAKEVVISAGFEWDLDEAASRVHREPDEPDLLRESAWVILNSGMRTSVVAAKFGRISEAFNDWNSAKYIRDHREACLLRAMATFRHRPKLEAIATVASVVADRGLTNVLYEYHASPMEALRQFPYIGPVTSHHLAKNLGLDIAKPDRHLVRMAMHAGWADAVEMCRRIGVRVGEPAAVVDSVLWRYATIAPEARGWDILLSSGSPEIRP